MGCSNDCNQGRSCNCMNPYDEQHTKFLRTDPYKHTEFQKEESTTSIIINTALLVIALSLITCVLFLG